jgi:hypothetical protein
MEIGDKFEINVGKTTQRSLLDRIKDMDINLIDKFRLRDLPFNLIDGDYNITGHSPSIRLLLLYPQNKKDEIKEVNIRVNDIHGSKRALVTCDYENKCVTFPYYENRIRILRNKPW